jgi:hypothetical protein
MRSALTVLISITAISFMACAPRVSKRPPASSAPTTLAQAEAKGRAEAKPVRTAAAAPIAAPAPPAEPQPTFVRLPPPPPPAPAALPEGEEDEISPPEPPAPPKKKTYYAYSDAEIGAMRAQSKDFRRLDDQLKACAKKSEHSISRREEIPAEIAKIRMSKGGLTPRKEKKIAKLIAEKERLASSKSDSGCSDIEERLTRMLQSSYEAEAALY